MRFSLDRVFGAKNFKNEICWKSGGNAKNKKQLGRWHDTIVVYSKTNKGKFNPIYLPYDEEYKKKSSVKVEEVQLDSGETIEKEYVTTAIHNSQPDINPRKNLRYEWKGHHKQWYVSKEKMQTLHDQNRLQYSLKSGTPRIKRYLDEMSGVPVRDLWIDINQIQGPEKLDYATQKPVKLLQRIVKLYSDEGDLVLDPFAGSGTTGRACIKESRNYLLIDISPKAKIVFES